MVGAKNESDFEKASNLLNGMGTTIVHCGQPGDGAIAKLVNNLILGIQMVASSEGIAFGEKLGIDAKTLHKVLSASSSNNWCL
jgi:3-hydroxyisobutyrate dehydrogenase